MPSACSPPAPPAAAQPAGHAFPARRIAISRNVMGMVGDTSAGILLSQLIHWTRRGPDVVSRDGWVCKTAQDWYHETGLTWKAQRRAREILFRARLLEERKLFMPARLEYRINLPEMVRRLCNLNLIAPAELSFADLQGVNDLADLLLGRCFVYHTAIARRWSVHTAMMCSRLLAGVRVLAPVAAGSSGLVPGRIGIPFQTRPVRLHRIQWLVETGLTRDQWQTARRHLKAAGVLIEFPHNFPRRVDLAVDVAALARALAAGPGAAPAQRSPKAGQDRTKQANRPPPSQPPVAESPCPADSDRPIQPITIALPNRYLFELMNSKQQPPLVRERASGDGLAWQAFGFGGGGDVYDLQSPGLNGTQDPAELPAQAAQPAQRELPDHPGQPREAAAPQRAEALVAAALQASPPVTPEAPASLAGAAGPAAAARPAGPDSAPTLVWSGAFTDGDRVSAARHLAGLDSAMQQAILDEVDWMQQSGPVRSPVGLVRALRRQADAGAFVPDGAHRVQAARQAARARAEAQAQVRADSARSAADPARRETGAQSAPPIRIKPEIAERLRQLRAGLAARRVA